MEQRINYQNQNVYVGIDVHKRTYSLSCIHEGALVKRATIKAEAAGLVSFLRKFFIGARVHCAYEAGFSGFGLHRHLESEGIDSIVVNPASIEISSRDKVKTDKRDSLKIATQLAAGRLRAIAVPSYKQELMRLVTRTREQLVSEKTRLGQQIKSRLFQFGLIGADDRRVMSEAFIDDYLARKLPEELHDAITLLAKLWRVVNDEVNAYRGKLAKQAKEDARIEAVYRSVPGIGPIASRTLANELGDMSDSKNVRGLNSFIGFTPSEHSSGNNRRLGHITKQGSARLRWILTEAAWRAIKKDPRLQSDFNRISLRAGKKRAIVAIARKLAVSIRACFQKKEFYQLDFGLAA